MCFIYKEANECTQFVCEKIVEISVVEFCRPLVVGAVSFGRRVSQQNVGLVCGYHKSVRIEHYSLYTHNKKLHKTVLNFHLF